MKYLEILKRRFNSWKEVESIIEALPTTYEKGEAFEQFVFAYLSLNKSQYQIKELYRSKDIPLTFLEKYRIEKKDSGVDGFIVFEDGKVAGYQVKFRVDRKVPSYDELAKFWVESQYTDYNYIVANCYYLTELALKNPKHLAILVDTFDSLTDDFFAEFHSLANSQVVKERNILRPYPFQIRMINDILEGFKKNDRGKLIAACGTGKTLTSLWVAEKIKASSVLFIAPSLALIKQTLEKWMQNSIVPIDYICVCSDKTVVNEDEGDILASEIGVPVTTDKNELIKFLSSPKAPEKLKVVFSTYQSLDVVSNASLELKSYSYDLAIFDEAHRTAGSKDSSLFSLGLNNDFINIHKRLFMTATERLIKPWIKKKAEENERILFSMDDENLYGPVFHRFSFGEAIKESVISDYRVVVASTDEKSLLEMLNKNNILEVINKNNSLTNAQNLFKQLLLLKSFQELPIKKTITFHSNVLKAKEFINGVNSNELTFADLVKSLGNFNNSFFLDHVNGSMSSGKRKEIMHNFEISEYGIVSNARCLTEGVDVPLIDSIYFVNPKTSIIDIVQACGRALRKNNNDSNKTAYFIIPVIVSENNNAGVNSEEFEMVFNVIQALRDQDSRMAEWIDTLNDHLVKGKVSKFSSGKTSPISIILPKSINIDDFSRNLLIRIADVNKNPITFLKTKSYGKNERKSQFKRVFKTIGDISYDSFQKNLVDPTLARFKNVDEIVETAKLVINNNNLSHTERLGLLIRENKYASLTPLGKAYFRGQIKFIDLFKRQMLYYFSKEELDGKEMIIFPYRTTLKVLLEKDFISFTDFVFGIYSLNNSESDFVYQSINRINTLRSRFPNIEQSNISNREKLIVELNNLFETNFSITDLWEKKTTINNQFIYFRNHLSLFGDMLEIDNSNRVIRLQKEGYNNLRKIINDSNMIESYTNISILREQYTTIN